MQERLARIEQLFTRDKLRTAEVLTSHVILLHVISKLYSRFYARHVCAAPYLHLRFCRLQNHNIHPVFINDGPRGADPKQHEAKLQTWIER